jgi:hypothetical protein
MGDGRRCSHKPYATKTLFMQTIQATPAGTMAVLAIVFLFSCDTRAKKGESLANEDFAPVVINNQYGLKLPKYMKAATNLHDDASLQYQNVFKETYTIVIDENKQGIIDLLIENDLYDSTQSILANYASFQKNATSEALEIKSETELKKIIVNDLAAQQWEVNGKVEDVPQEVGYVITYVEGKDNLYMLMSWTLGSRKEKYRDTFLAIAESFTENHKP